MKVVIAILLIVGAIFGGWQVYSYWVKVQDADKEPPAAVATTIPDDQLPGLPPTLESILQASRAKGATGLKNFLLQYGNTISDPRRASIELDYAVLVAQRDTAEAKKVFARVKDRLPPTSPVYPRVKELEKTYE